MKNKIFEVEGLSLDKINAFTNRITEINKLEDNIKNISVIIKSLKSLNLQVGSVIVISFPNSKMLVKYFFSVLLAGFVPALVSPSMFNSRLIEAVKKLGAAGLISSKKGIIDNSINRTKILIGTTLFYSFQGDLKIHAPGDVIMMTSGTSGIFSGCLHSVTSLVKNALRHIQAVGLKKSDVVLVNLPIYFSYAFVAQIIASFLSGAKVVIASPPFSYENYFYSIEQYGITFSSLTPFLIRSIVAKSPILPAGLRTLTIGGDFLESEYVKKIVKNNPDKKIYLTYGLTEAGPRVSTLAAHLEQKDKYTSVGKPLEGVVVSLVKDKEDDDYGELVVTADTVYKYKVGMRDDDKRSKKISQFSIYTGDIFSIDNEGYLYFKGRKSEFIVLNGEKISLLSIKRLVNSVPNVLKSSVKVINDSLNDKHYVLDVFVNGINKKSFKNVRDNICKKLQRNEMPKKINIYDITEAGIHK